MIALFKSHAKIHIPHMQILCDFHVVFQEKEKGLSKGLSAQRSLWWPTSDPDWQLGWPWREFSMRNGWFASWDLSLVLSDVVCTLCNGPCVYCIWLLATMRWETADAKFGRNLLVQIKGINENSHRNMYRSCLVHRTLYCSGNQFDDGNDVVQFSTNTYCRFLRASMSISLSYRKTFWSFLQTQKAHKRY